MTFRRLAPAAGFALFVGAARLAGQAPMTVDVDAREAPRRVFHARLRIPAAAGPLTLLYPQWLPGEHSPTGPIADLAGLRFSAGGRTLPWKRDPVDMYAFHLDVPAGAGAVEVALDFLSPAAAQAFTSGPSSTPELALVSWNQVLLYPKSVPPDELVCAASLRLPEGWKYGTALAIAREGADGIAFAPVSLTALVDSPVLAGAHFRTVTLDGGPIPHRIRIAADGDAALAMRPEEEAAYRNLVAETGALFGARHYRHYDFLLTLSDHVAHFGLEHHESSDDRVAERSLIDEDARRMMAGLLPHEMVHSWNGKYRRPADLAPGHFDQPMQGDLLWVYEGLTEYLGQVLAARAKLLTPAQYREALAETAGEMDIQRGRDWRPLADTAVAAQILFPARPDGGAWRRGTDFYPESELLWLEADTIIRSESAGKRSLDDFCRLFHGAPGGPPAVRPYRFEDVVAALNQVAPYDWSGFWKARLEGTRSRAPLDGIAAGGWRLAYGPTPTEMQRAAEETGRLVDARFSLGFTVDDDGDIPDVIPESPAARAGVAGGSKLVAVNGRRYSRDLLRDAIRDSASRPVELIVENGDAFATHRLEYSGGERYPRLERDETRPDLLSKITAPLVPASAATP
ncbi:MAG TPA: PDZ domain-containing protein [Thermoanaerobaculia bacterium]|nr:PDZ domain-containing protein [Thermoanaerobaculia bacterium]